jgi:hypothetical protein
MCDDPALSLSIWAFCLITSAGASTAQDAISATDEADEWIKGSGRGRTFEKASFVPSYVEKKMPALKSQSRFQRTKLPGGDAYQLGP